MKRIYVSLDELLDTRLGFIGMVKPELLDDYLEPGNPKYFKRMHDSVLWNDLGITEVDWYRIREKRTVDLLRASVITHIPKVIMRIIKYYHQSQDKQLGGWDITLNINTYPYQLTPEELTEIREILEETIPLVSRINFFEASLKGLTPNYLKNNFDYVLLYDFHFWSKIHAEELKKMYLTNMHFFVPRLFNSLPTDEDFKGLEKVLEMDPFKLLEGAISYKMGLTFIPASDFSSALTKPIHQSSENQDLDDLLAQFGYGIDGSPQADPQYPSHPQSTSEMEVKTGQA